MRILPLVAAITISLSSMSTLAQEALIEFVDGEIASAEDVNSNFKHLSNRLRAIEGKDGCYARDEDGSTIVECADGTSVTLESGEGRLDGINSNATAIATNAENVAANRADIDTNTANLALNTQSIVANRADIDTNTANLALNTQSIVANRADIDTNTANIAANRADIDFLRSAEYSGCSAAQEGNSVVITCADGTSAVLPGAGSVVVVEGTNGVTPDISNIPLNFYVIDGNGDPIATFLSGALPLEVASIHIAGSPSLEAVLEVDPDAEQVILTSASDTWPYWLHYTSDDCSGPAFITQPGLKWVTEISRGVYGRPTQKIRTYWKSRRKPGYFRDAYFPPSDVCEPIDSISEAILLEPYEPPPALLNPIFPLTVDSLP